MPEVTLLLRGEAVRCSVGRDGEDFLVRLSDREHRFRLAPVESGVLLLTAMDRTRLVRVAEGEGSRFLHVDGVTVEYAIGRADASPDGGPRPGGAGFASADLTAPMPGLVTQVFVREGEAVKPGQPLVIVEAMKMEHVVRATQAGIVRALLVRTGEQVQGGAVVAEIGPSGSGPRRTGRRK